MNHRIRVADRCDRCGAQAFAFAIVIDVCLFFCAHHFRRHEVALRLVASEVWDETYRLTEENRLKGAHTC